MSPLAMLALTALVPLADRVTVVAHHKSGTRASSDVLIQLCCPENSAVWEWSVWLGSCEERCAAQGVNYYPNGLPLDWEPTPNERVVHFAREPVDMIVSGYLYHRACNEPQWTDVPLDRDTARDMAMTLVPGLTVQANFFGSAENIASIRALLDPKRSLQNTSYCKLLQAASPEMGMRAETLRSLYAADGVSRMLADHTNLARRLPQQHPAPGSHGTLLPASHLDETAGKFKTACMDDLLPFGSKEANTTWNALASFIGLREVDVTFEDSHTTEVQVGDPTRYELGAMAIGELQAHAETFELSSLHKQGFPCANSNSLEAPLDESGCPQNAGVNHLASSAVSACPVKALNQTIAIVVPIHPPKFGSMVDLLRTYEACEQTERFDIFVVFSSTVDRAAWEEASRELPVAARLQHLLVGINANETNPPTKKKLRALQQLSSTLRPGLYKHTIIADADMLFQSTSDFTRRFGARVLGKVLPAIGKPMRAAQWHITNASCAAVGIDLASEVARHGDQPARRLDRFLWWGDAPVYDMYDAGDFLDRLDWNQMHDPLVFDHLAYMCYKIYVGNWSILRAGPDEIVSPEVQAYGFEEASMTDQEVFRQEMSNWAKGAVANGSQEEVRNAVGYAVTPTRGYPWLWSRDPSKDRLLQFHVDRENARFPLSDGCGAFYEHKRSGPRGIWELPGWLENSMHSENLWAFDAVFPNATVKFDAAGDVLQRGVAPERFTAAELMWRNFVDIGFFEQMKQDQNTTSMLCDIGAADGAVTAYVVEAFKMTAHAYDIMLPEKNIFSMEEQRAKTPIRLFDGEHIPEQDDACDLTLFSYVLHHAAASTFKLLQEAKRVTRPGGFVLVAEDMAITDDMARAQRNAEHDPHGIFRSEEEWRALLPAMGLQVVDYGPLWPGNSSNPQEYFIAQVGIQK